MTIDDRPRYRYSWKYGFWHVSNGVGPNVLCYLRQKAVERKFREYRDEQERLQSTGRVPEEE